VDQVELIHLQLHQEHHNQQILVMVDQGLVDVDQVVVVELEDQE
jgi:hypothetical protein